MMVSNFAMSLQSSKVWSIQQTIKLQKIPFIYSTLYGMVLPKVSGDIVIIAFKKVDYELGSRNILFIHFHILYR